MAKDYAQTDHDILTRLVEKTDNNHSILLDKMEGVKIDVREVKDGITLQIAKMETRLVMLETFKQTKLIDGQIDRWNAASAWAEEFQGRWKWMAGGMTAVGGIIVYLIDHIETIWRTLHR